MTRLTEVADGVLVGTSERFTTTTTVVTGPDGGCLLIDPAVTPGGLAELAGNLAARGLAPRAGWATHPHWDHVLWSRALGDVPRYAAPRAVVTAQTERDGLVSGVQDSAPGHDLGLFGQLAGSSALADYRTGLDRLAALASQVRQVVPGHGHIGDAAEFGRRLAADRAYLDALERGERLADPRLTQEWLRAGQDRQIAFVTGQEADAGAGQAGT